MRLFPLRVPKKSFRKQPHKDYPENKRIRYELTPISLEMLCSVIVYKNMLRSPFGHLKKNDFALIQYFRLCNLCKDDF